MQYTTRNVTVVIEHNLPDGTRAKYKQDLPHLDAVAEALSTLRGAHVRSLLLYCCVKDVMHSHLQYAFRQLQIHVDSAILDPPTHETLTVASSEDTARLGRALEAVGTKSLQLSHHYADSVLKLPSLGGVEFLELQMPTLPASSARILSLVFSNRVPRISLQMAVIEQSPALAAADFVGTIMRELRTRTKLRDFPRMLLVECLDPACAEATMTSISYWDMRNTPMYGGGVSVREADGVVGEQEVFYFEKQDGCITLLVSAGIVPAGKLDGADAQFVVIKVIPSSLFPDANGEIVLNEVYSHRASPFRED